MSANKISREQAEQEINQWMDFKKEDDRDKHKENIETLVKSMVSGYLILDTEKMEFTQMLKFPTDGEMPMTKLTYKSRLSVAQTQAIVKGLKTDDLVAFSVAYACALTGQPKELIRKLDTIDFRVTQAIAGFFS